MRNLLAAAGVLAASLIASGGPALAQGAGGGAPGVEVQTVTRQAVHSQNRYNGRIEATEKVDISARVEGYLGERLYEEGALVKEGDLLFVIEKDQYEANLAQAEANLESAKAAEKLAETSYKRAKTLVARKAVAQSQLDDATAELQTAKADVLAAEAAVRLAQLDLDYTDVRAPIDGRIGKALFSKGAYVGPSSGSLALLVAQDPIHVAWPVPSRLFTEIQKRGTDSSSVIVKLQLADGSLYDQEGRILYIEPSANRSTNTITARATVPNPAGLLVDDQLVTVIIESKEDAQEILVPQASLQIDQQGPYVMIVNESGQAEVRRLETGEQDGKLIIVKSGLSEGEKVIVSGQQKVRPGMPVTAHEAGTE